MARTAAAAPPVPPARPVPAPRAPPPRRARRGAERAVEPAPEPRAARDLAHGPKHVARERRLQVLHLQADRELEHVGRPRAEH